MILFTCAILVLGKKDSDGNVHDCPPLLDMSHRKAPGREFFGRSWRRINKKEVSLVAMTEKQKLFAEEYLIDLNATRAYKAAYPSVKNDNTASAAAARLLRNVRVKAYIDERLAEIHDEKTADAKEVMEYLTSVMRGESASEEIVVEGIGDGMSEARTMEKRPSEKDRLKAAELLGKRYALFTDKVDMDTDMDINITIDYGDDA